MLNARITAATLALALVGFAPNVLAAKGDVVQKLAHGEINWSAKTVTATGSGAANLKDGPIAVARLNAERAAKLDALRNILETLEGVQIDSKRSVGDMMSNGTIKSRVQGLARGFKVVDTRYYSDGSVDVVVEMPIDDNLTSALAITPAEETKISTSGKQTFTGLIVNAKGLGVLPSIAPQVIDEKGAPAYGAEFVSEQGMKDGGIASYVSSMDEAKAQALVGQNPLVVKALRLGEKAKTDVVISNADAQKLRDKEADLSFLVNGKVVIVVD